MSKPSERLIQKLNSKVKLLNYELTELLALRKVVAEAEGLALISRDFETPMEYPKQ